MGCSTSKGVCHHHHHHDFDHVDDSIHALLRHDLKYAKAHGIEPHGYRPRDPHPLLDGPSSSSAAAASQRQQQQQQSRTAYTDVTVTDTDSTHELITQQQEQQHEQRQENSSYHSTGSSSTKEETDEEMNRVLNQYKHHCDTIDPRDVSSSLDRNPLLSIIHHHPVITAVEED